MRDNSIDNHRLSFFYDHDTGAGYVGACVLPPRGMVRFSELGMRTRAISKIVDHLFSQFFAGERLIDWSPDYPSYNPKGYWWITYYDLPYDVFHDAAETYFENYIPEEDWPDILVGEVPWAWATT